jgi:hypothetical protein
MLEAASTSETLFGKLIADYTALQSRRQPYSVKNLVRTAKKTHVTIAKTN